MADTKISALTTGTTPAVGDEFVIARSGANNKLTWSQMCGNITASGAVGITPASGSNLNVTLATTGDFAVNTSQLYVDTSAARVGIGTTSPSEKLEVKGTAIKVMDAGSQEIKFSYDAALGGGTIAGLKHYYADGWKIGLRVWDGATSGGLEGITLWSNGNVGIGTTGPTANLHVSASTTARASLCVPHGTAPTSPVDGDIWTTTAGLYVRINGSTVGPLS